MLRLRPLRKKESEAAKTAVLAAARPYWGPSRMPVGTTIDPATAANSALRASGQTFQPT